MSFIGKCKCCLENGGLKNLWAEYYRSGEKEVYGEMLIECFALTWQQPDETEEHIEEICEGCIARLHDAYNFKKQVLASEELLQEEIRQSKDLKQKIKIKVETDSDEENVLLKYEPDFDNETEYKCETDSETIPDFLSKGHADDDCLEYEEIEFLDDEFEDQEGNKNYMTSDNESSTSKQPSRKRGRNVKRPYKDYPEEKLLEAIKAVVNEDMTPVEAADSYNVPLKTLRGRLQSKMKAPSPDITNSRKRHSQKEHLQLIEEIKQILLHTDATPFKTKAAKYYCAYCDEAVVFDDPDELRSHTSVVHAENRINGIDQVMRPSWNNESLKMDIDNLHCTECCIGLNSWDGMFTHLAEVHNLHLIESHKKVVPYLLQADLHCVLCKEKFTNYHLLDGHMNCHYDNYICEECGDTFITDGRFKKHSLTHTNGRYPCEECGKVFALEKYKRKHFTYVHNKGYVHKCPYCKITVQGDYPRHLHILEFHPEKIKMISCELCGKEFSWRPYYLKHLRLYHQRRNGGAQCKFCSKTFDNREDMKAHQKSHRFPCPGCSRPFSTLTLLTRHVQNCISVGKSTVAVLVE